MLLSLQGCTEKAIKKPTDILFSVLTCHIITRQQWPVTLTAAATRLGGVGDPRARWWWWWPVAGVQRPGAGTVHGARYRPDTSPAYSEEFNLVFIEIQLELCQRSSAAAAAQQLYGFALELPWNESRTSWRSHLLIFISEISQGVPGHETTIQPAAFMSR